MKENKLIGSIDTACNDFIKGGGDPSITVGYLIAAAVFFANNKAGKPFSFKECEEVAHVLIDGLHATIRHRMEDSE